MRMKADHDREREYSIHRYQLKPILLPVMLELELQTGVQASWVASADGLLACHTQHGTPCEIFSKCSRQSSSKFPPHRWPPALWVSSLVPVLSTGAPLCGTSNLLRICRIQKHAHCQLMELGDCDSKDKVQMRWVVVVVVVVGGGGGGGG